jgi:hypothetical protein
MIDVRACDFETIMNAISSNNERWGIMDVVLELERGAWPGCPAARPPQRPDAPPRVQGRAQGPGRWPHLNRWRRHLRRRPLLRRLSSLRFCHRRARAPRCGGVSARFGAAGARARRARTTSALAAQAEPLLCCLAPQAVVSGEAADGVLRDAMLKAGVKTYDTWGTMVRALKRPSLRCCVC